MTAVDDKEDDEFDLGVLLLDELTLGGGSLGPYICELDAGVGQAEPVEVMARGQT